MMSSERPHDATGEPGDDAPAAAARHLALLDALLDVAGDAPAYAPLFGATRNVFAFDQAMVLRDEGDLVRCVAADPVRSEDLAWPPSPAFAQAVRSRVLVLAGGEPSEERALIPAGLVSADDPALLVPIAADGRHAAL